MGLLLVVGGIISIAFFVTFFALLFENGDAWYQVLIAAIFFAGIAAIGGVAEYKAGQNCIITTKEYKAFKLERISVNSEKPMLIRETHYHYPNYSVFYNDKSEYEILRIEE